MAKKPLKDAKTYRAALVGLTNNVRAFLQLLDRTMKEKESNERGKKIAALSNELEMANDRVRFFTLDVDWRKKK